MSPGTVDALLVTARRDSVRLRFKNRLLVGGFPLWIRPCILGERLGIRTVVDSDDELILQDAAAHGYETHRRSIPPESEGGTHWHAIQSAAIDLGLSSFALLQPTSPFRNAETVLKCIAAFNGHRAVLTVSPGSSDWDGNVGVFTGQQDHVPCDFVAIDNDPVHGLQIDTPDDLMEANRIWHTLLNGGLW